MAYAVPEEDPEEAARVEKVLVRGFGGRVEELKKLNLKSVEGAFVNRMDTELNVFRRMVNDRDMRQIKSLLWKYRRQLPPVGRLKLPPDDPVVREMEANGG